MNVDDETIHEHYMNYMITDAGHLGRYEDYKVKPDRKSFGNLQF